ncbi:rod shape-determining protein [Enterovibrio sp. 27052020O]|uniref:rod shape-determining protein n=1 Tax=Enterovibrio sp. 27052020O TaxID=3241166 RepID=UPI00388E8218
MLTRFIYAYGSTLYIQIWENRLRVLNGTTGRVFDEQPLIAWTQTGPIRKRVEAIGDAAHALKHDIGTTVSNPFSHPRSLIGDYAAAETVIHHAISQVTPRSFFQPKIQVILHPMEKIEGGLTDIEKKALRDMAYQAGAKNAYVYWGDTLPSQHLINAGMKESQIANIDK